MTTKTSFVPRQEIRARIGVRLTDSDRDALEHHAVAQGVTLSEAAREVMRRGLEQAGVRRPNRTVRSRAAA